MDTIFGDADPEDGWDRGDDAPHKIAILIRLALSVSIEHENPAHDRIRALVRLGFATAAVEALRLTAGPDTIPILDALDLAFYYLTVTESSGA